MTVSRWKVMAGVLGVSLGGLAALAGQAPKVGETRRAEPPVPTDATPEKVKPAAPPLDVPPPPIPTLPTVGTSAPAPLPTLPMLNEPPIADAKKPAVTPLPVMPAGGVTVPTTTVSVVPVAGQLPPLPSEPKAAEPMSPKSAPAAPTGATIPLTEFKPIDAVQSAVPITQGYPATPSSPTITPQATAPVIEPVAARSTPVAVAPAAVAAAMKYRILLRVGEGDPSFEVRNGDDLMMKVVCEKVDIASPAQKGQTMQQVKASGKVRFAGFGSEGTCDELSFIAGTGELMLAGNVTIQVKDKLGRIDSELKSDKVKYKLDASAMPGVMKP